MSATVPMLLAARAEVDADRTAITVAGGGTLTFGRWRERAAALAGGLAAAGVRPGDRVGLLFAAGEWDQFAVAYVGAQWAGAVAVPLSARQPAEALSAMLERCAATALVHGSALPVPPTPAVPLEAVKLEACGGAPASAAIPDGMAQILYTSGTTATPKGVYASHANLVYGSWPPPRHRPLRHSRQFLHAFPIGTNAASMMVVNALVAHASALVAATFDADGFCALIAAERVGTVYLVPATAIEILRAAGRHDLSGVHLVNSSAAPLPPAVAAPLARAFPNATLVNSYTSTESAPAQTAMIIDPARPGSVGRPVGAGDVRVAGDDGRPLPAGEIGEVLLRSGGPQRGYYGDPDATAAVFPPGWTRMGDLGYLDADGYLFLVDRDSDLIKTGGIRVSTLQVEAVLHEHAAVAEAAVLGVPHPTMGTMVAAAVVLRGPASPEDLRAFARARLAAHETPARILVVAELPHNPTGKVVKRDLRALFTGPTSGPAAPEASDAVTAALAAIWAEVFPGVSTTPGDFFAAGGDSLRATQLTTLIRDRLGIDVPTSFAFDRPGFAAQADWLRAAPAPDRSMPAGRPTHPPATPEDGATAAGVTPMTGVQEHWWRWLNEVPGRRQMPPVHIALRVREPLDADALDRALVDLARRHEGLRSVVVERDGRPVLLARPAAPAYLTRSRAAGPDPAARLADAAARATAVVTAPFDVAAGPLLRAHCVTLSDDDHVLVVAVHHLVFDGWSTGVLLGELATRYSAHRTATATEPAPPVSTFADFVAADRARWSHSARHWQRVLDGAPRTLASLPGRRDGVRAVSGDERGLPIGGDVVAGLREVARRHRMSVAMTVAAAWAATLSAWSGSDDLVLAQPVAGRIRPEYRDTVGCLFRWILIRVRAGAGATLDTIAAQVRAGTLGADDHQFYDYGRFHRAVGFPAYVRFDGWARPAHLPGVVSEPFEVPAGPNMAWPLAPDDPDRYPPELLVREGADGGLTGTLIYNRLAYDGADVEALAARAAAHWRATVSYPDRPVADLWGYAGGGAPTG